MTSIQNFNNSAHVLIIGGAGYVGSILTRELLDSGRRVRVLDKLIYDNGESLSYCLEHPRFSFIRGDFGDDTTLDTALKDIDSVVLLAALVGDPICKKYPDLARMTNLEFPVKLTEKLRGKGIGKFIFTSTCSNYGLRVDDSPADEKSDLNPQSLYAETKVSFEKHLLSPAAAFDFCPTVLRLSTAFGLSSRMRFDLTISEFTRELALGKNLLVYDENTWRPYCHVADISAAIIAVLNAPEEKVRGEVFNVGSNSENYTKKMIVDLISRHIPGATVEYRSGGFDPRNYRVAFDKISNVLNFRTAYSAEMSVLSVIDAVRNGLFADCETRKNFYGNYSIDI